MCAALQMTGNCNLSNFSIICITNFQPNIKTWWLVERYIVMCCFSHTCFKVCLVIFAVSFSFTDGIGQEIASELQHRIMIMDGGMGTMIQSYKLQEKDFHGINFVLNCLVWCNSQWHYQCSWLQFSNVGKWENLVYAHGELFAWHYVWQHDLPVFTHVQ